MANAEIPNVGAVLDAIDGGVVVLDAGGHVVQWNAWMATASGITGADVHGKTLGEIFPDFDARRLRAAVQAALTTGASSSISHSLNPAPLPLRTRAGRKMLHDITVSPAGNHPNLACLVFVTDVTMTTRRDQFLRDQHNARYNAVVESAPDAIMTIDGDGLIQMANPAAVTHFGYPMDELVGMHAGVLFDEEATGPMPWRVALEGDCTVQPKEVTALNKDGSYSYVEMSASRWNIGARAVVTVILRDVAERRAINAALRASESAARSSAAALAELNQGLEERVQQRTAQLMKAEEALRQSQKMEAIGQLTGGIAHDFNNLLQGITGSLHVIQKLGALGRISEMDRFLKGALDSAHRAASLTHRLLAFSRRQPIDPRPVDVNELIGSMHELVRRTIGETIKMDVEANEALWLVRCDANQLENAILNLAINARDAMPAGGTLTFTTANKVLDLDTALRHELLPGDYVSLTITDTGEGMPPEVQARVFEPFYTTKAIGKGTGLGLSMIYGFVKQSHGSIQITSEVGKGTAIEIWLPRHTGSVEAEPPATASSKERRAGIGEVVLVVEDEGVVRLLVLEVLKELGYYALEAENGATAVQILQSKQRIDLLVSDIGLPDINGVEVVRVARETRKNLKVLLMTGYAEKAAGDSFLQEGAEIIMKPFNMDVLATRIRDIIESR
ncbi:MAG TPA: PAS domain S-box protein [Pseudomonadales bacterium]